MSAPIEVDVAVIGAGPAGLAAAEAAAREGAAVAIVDPNPPGGRASREALLPSAVARELLAERPAGGWAAVAEAIESRRSRYVERLSLGLEDHAIEHLRARARFTDANAFTLSDGRALRFESAVLCPGARPRELPGSVETASSLESLFHRPRPKSALVIGGDVQGAELAHLLSAWEVEVTWMADELGLLPSFERELAERVGDDLLKRGVKLVHDKSVARLEQHAAEGALAHLDGGRTYAAEVALLAIGQRPRLEPLGLDAVGLAVAEGEPLEIDAEGRTAKAHLFAAGGVTTRGSGSVARAEAEGRVSGRAAAGGQGGSLDPSRVPLVAYTGPTIAEVGMRPSEARGPFELRTLRYEEGRFGAHLPPTEELQAAGLVRVLLDEEGRIRGAGAWGRRAEEIVSAVGALLELGASAEMLLSWTPAEPSALGLLARALR